MSDLDGSPLTGDPSAPDVLALVAAIRPVRPLAARPEPAPARGVPLVDGSPTTPGGPTPHDGPAPLGRVAARPGAARVGVGAPAPASAGRPRPAR